jgi:NADH-quinone oxidoreductase subunit E
MTKKSESHATPGKPSRAHNPGWRGNRRHGTRELELTPAVAQWFAAASAQFPHSRPSTIPMLQSAQAALGYLPRDAMQAIARHLGASPAVIEGVASFYAQFRFTAPGRHRVTVCSGTACYVRGSGKLMDDIRADLRIAPGETSADGAVSLESVSCFGACALAPVVVVDDKVLRQQTSASMKKVIGDLGTSSTAGTDPKRENRGQSPGAPGARK